MIINNVVHGGPPLCIPAHLSYGQFILDKLKEQYVKDDAVAMINGDTGYKTTYKYILQETVNFAAGLQKIGVKRGDVVALFCENRDEFLIAAMAGTVCGATVTTLNVMYTKGEIIHVTSISKPSVIICSEMALQRNLDTLKSIQCIKKIIQINGNVIDPTILPYSRVLVETNVMEFEAVEVQGWTDVAYILYSSGTTGLPKGVMITHVNALYTGINLHYGKENKEGPSRYLTIVPWCHAYGLMSTINYMIFGVYIVYFTTFNPEKYLNAIQEHKLTHLLTVPPIVVFLAKHPLVLKYDLSSVQIVWCGAAPLSAETISLALKRLKNCRGIFQGYGMTETSLAATRDFDDDKVPRKPGSGGYPVAGVKIKVVDVETRRKLGPNEHGEICVKGPIVMKGYVGKEKESREILDEEGFLKTGDIGYYDKDGCFYIVDRLKELIKYKSYQVAPAAVENVLIQHNGVSECGVVGAPDEIAGELPTAFVVPKPGVKITERELIEFSNSRINSINKQRNTSKQLLQQIVNLSMGLKKLGVKRGDVVAICSENTDEYLVAVIAILCCGATVTTMNILSTNDEIKHFLDISKPRSLLGSESVLKKYVDIFKSTLCIRNIIQFNGSLVDTSVILYDSISINTNVAKFEPSEVDGREDGAFIMYSSGTSGLPKGVLLTHENVLHGILILNTGFKKEKSRVISVMPWYHVYGLLTTIEFIINDHMVVYLPKFIAEKYFAAIQEYEIDVLLTVPLIIVLLAKSPLAEAYDLSSVEYVWCASAPLNDVIEALAHKHLRNCKGILQAYGLTETTLVIIKNWYDLKITNDKPGINGIPLPGVKLKVVDVINRHKLGENQKGEICVSGPMITKGYIQNEVATNDMFDEEGYLKTGDVGYYDKDGCIFIIDRIKEIIKYKGHQVPPANIERVVLQHDDVSECVVIGAPDEVAGEIPTAFVVFKPGTNVTEQELINFTNARLSPIDRIRGGIIRVDEIPKTASGKCIRRELKKKLEEIDRNLTIKD